MDARTREAFLKKVAEEPFSRLLDIRLVDVREGYALCEMLYTSALDNVHGIAHGGAVFSLIDEAFEISSNSHGTVALALNMNMTFIKRAVKNSLLRAESKEVSKSRRTATYQITVEDSEGLVAICQALVYRKNDEIQFLKAT
ncbi:MAG TPA: PaaI family thioesterase [Syntrophorhabdales bacterium]|jgi:acyl-CoA thioesterase|nr:PaaI family thioesterase [Syntrophorhabdales bacterium]